MIKPLLKLSFTIFILASTLTAFGQTGTLSGADDKTGDELKSDKTDASSSIKFGVTYISNNVYAGRADTITTPVIVPEIKYTFKSGIFLSANLFVIPNKPKQKLDGGNLEGGYDFDITDDLSGSASFAKYFYAASSTQIASSISGTFNVTLEYDIADIISPSVIADYDLNKQGITNDIMVTPGIAHDFIVKGVFSDEDVLLVSPTVSASLGTQNFYDAYLTKKNFKSIKRTKAQNTLLNSYITRLGKFDLLDFELSAPLIYKTGHFIFQLVPTYARAQNQLPAGIEARLADQTSVFYVDAGVSLKF